jgi:hypothetical protein
LLEELERDVKAVRKARETLGDRAPTFKREGGGFREGGRDGGILGKRRRDDAENSGSDVPEDVASIPMPRDTPPPIPKEVLDKWYSARRERNAFNQQQQQGGRGAGTNANNMPLGGNARLIGKGVEDGTEEATRVPTPVVEAKTVYEAAPAIRDLRKEAVSAFVPAAVRLKMEKAKGKGGLVEPEEADALEREGYLGGKVGEAGQKEDDSSGPRGVMMEEVEDEDD